MNLKWVSDQTLISWSYRLKTSPKILAVLVMVEIWALPLMFWIPITPIYALSCLETLPKAPITSGTISVLTLCSVLITSAKSIYFRCSWLVQLDVGKIALSFPFRHIVGAFFSCSLLRVVLCFWCNIPTESYFRYGSILIFFSLNALILVTLRPQYQK